MNRYLPLTLCILFGLTACAGSLRAQRPPNEVTNRAVTELWASDIKRVARSGDWILTRSYSAAGDAVVFVTSGESFSHASLYDAERGTVIEAIRPAVREVSVEQLLDRNRYAVIVRPDLSESERVDSVARARAVVGQPFDYSGMLGLDNKARFYCSELVAWASRIEHDERVMTPADLYERGELVYLSGNREELGVQRAALARAGRLPS